MSEYFLYLCIIVTSYESLKLNYKRMKKIITVFVLLSLLFINASKASEEFKDITELTFSTGNSASIPEKYREVALEHNWNPNTMTEDEMEKEYNSIMKKKYLRWTYLTIGIMSLLFSIKFIRTITK